MIRNLKPVGLVLVAALMLSAIVASSASAVGKFTTTGFYPQHIVSEDVGESDRFTANEMVVTCAGESYTGNLNGPSSTLTITPSFTDCTTPGGEFTIWTNGCYYEFTITETVSTDHDKGRMHLVCPGGKSMETLQFKSPHDHGTLLSNCKFTTGSQMGVGALNFTSQTASNDLLVHGQTTMTGQSHGACTFGFTLNMNFTLDLSTTFRASSGARIHVG